LSYYYNKANAQPHFCLYRHNQTKWQLPPAVLLPVIENVSKVYPTPKGPYRSEDVNLTVSEGEFICVIGHWLWQINAAEHGGGFNTPTTGRCNLAPSQSPSQDRIGWWCFRTTPCCPRRTAFENIYIAVNAVHPKKSKAEKTAIVEHLALVDWERADKKAAATLRWDETAGFDRTGFSDSSQSLDSG